MLLLIDLYFSPDLNVYRVQNYTLVYIMTMEESFCRIADAPCRDHKELVSFILEGVDLLDHTSIFLLRTINYRVISVIRILS